MAMKVVPMSKGAEIGLKPRCKVERCELGQYDRLKVFYHCNTKTRRKRRMLVGGRR